MKRLSWEKPKIAARRLDATKRNARTLLIVEDILEGKTDAELMKKYNLSASGLQTVFRKLVKARAIGERDVYGRPKLHQQSASDIPVRIVHRCWLDFDLPVFDGINPTLKGRIRDITVKGIGAIGLASTPGETRNLVIAAYEHFDLKPVVFRATCVWRRNSEENPESLTGFEISEIDDSNMARLQKLIQLITLRR